MGIVRDRGRYYWVKRVPKRFAGLILGQDGQPVSQMRQALHTDSRSEAIAKAAQIETVRLAEWEALAAGDSGSARDHYLTARKLAETRGFSYRPLADLSTARLADILPRISVLGPATEPASKPVAAAVLGTVPLVHPDFFGVLSEYFGLTKTRHLQKSDAQRHRWKLSKDRAVRNFLAAAFPDHSRPSTR
jgi:hypothetical protein